jgi:hypothetical protein
MPQKNVTPEQEKAFTDLLNQIGPAASMRIYGTWLNKEVQSGNHGPQFGDTARTVISGLSDAAQSLEGVR